MKKNLKYYSNLNYTIRIRKYPDNTYFAEIEELPGCFTEGDTKEEVFAMINDAKIAWIESAIDKNLPIPEPLNDEFSGKLNLRLPKSLHRSLAHQAKAEAVSLNTLINTKLAGKY